MYTGFRKGRGTTDQIANIHWIIEKWQNSRKTSTSALLTTLNPLTVWITTNCGKFLNRWEYQTTLPAFWETCRQVKKQQLQLDMEQWTGSKLGKEYVKAVYYHLAYLTPMQSTSCKMPGWMNHKLESRLLAEISITFRYADDTTLMAESKEVQRASWWKWKRRVKKLA